MQWITWGREGKHIGLEQHSRWIVMHCGLNGIENLCNYAFLKRERSGMDLIRSIEIHEISSSNTQHSPSWRRLFSVKLRYISHPDEHKGTSNLTCSDFCQHALNDNDVVWICLVVQTHVYV